MKIHGYPDPDGFAHRKFDLCIIDEHTAEGWIEDDFHHFGVTITHYQGKVTQVAMTTSRAPWSTCPGASQPLQELVGHSVTKRASDIGKQIDMRKQCTHVFDLTGLLLAHIGNTDIRNPHRRYHTVVPDRRINRNDYKLDNFGRGSAELYQDGHLAMQWEIDGETITAPTEYKNLNLNRGFRGWTEELPEQEAEHALILRRAIHVATGRAINSDNYATAAEMAEWDVCHTFQPGVREVAYRNYGSVIDYSKTPEDMLSNIITRVKS